MIQTPKIDFLRELRLAVCRPEGCLDADIADWILLYLIGLEMAELEPFNRLLDLTRLTEIRLSGPEIYDIAQARRLSMVNLAPVRTAILARSPLAYGIGRMYEMLMEPSPIQVCVCREAEFGAEWLQVPLPIVEPIPSD